MMRSLKPSQALLALLLLCLALLPVTSHLGLNAFYLDLAIRLMIFAIAATGLNLILGYGGLISLGHAAYLLIGAYSVAIPNYYDIDNGWTHLSLDIGCSALFALLTGAVSLRTRGGGFIMITLAFAQMIYFLFVSMETFGGSDGISISFTSNFGMFNLGNTLSLYYFTFAMLLVFLWLIYRLVRSRFGYALTGSRLRPQRMRSLGYSPYRFQLVAYIISGVITGIAGFLLANFVQFITPEMMDWFRSAELIFMVALGGAATVSGPVFGAFSFVILEHFMSEWTLYWHLPFGLILIAVAILSKGGLVKLLDSRAGRNSDA
jgi:branched-chain amino acid transport system permease protein